MGRLPARAGAIVEIGSFLDLVPGKEVNPGAVMIWMNKISVYTMTQCESKIYMIFGADGTLGKYPVITEPEDPPEDASRVTTKKWETRYAEFNKEKYKLDTDKGKLFGVMLGQMSENSKTRVRETVTGAKALDEHDPRGLLSAILSTHLGDNRLGADHNLYKVEQAFNLYSMQPGDHLPYYYQRFRALRSGVEEAYKRAGRNRQQTEDETTFTKAQLALKFTMGLNASYAIYKNYYEDNIKPWPETLEEAFAEASKFSPRRTAAGNHEGADRANAFATRGRFGGRGGRGRGGRSREDHQGRHTAGRSRDESPGASAYGTRKGECHHCGAEGHYAYECKERDAPGKGATGRSDGSRMQKGK
jgi:hypothetical protein